MENMTRAGIAGPVVLGRTYTEASPYFKNCFMYGGLRNPCMTAELAKLKYNNIMLIQRRTLCDSFQMNADYFDTLAKETKSKAARGYYRIRSRLLKECVYRMSR